MKFVKVAKESATKLVSFVNGDNAQVDKIQADLEVAKKEEVNELVIEAIKNSKKIAEVKYQGFRVSRLALVALGPLLTLNALASVFSSPKVVATSSQEAQKALVEGYHSSDAYVERDDAPTNSYYEAAVKYAKRDAVKLVKKEYSNKGAVYTPFGSKLNESETSEYRQWQKEQLRDLKNIDKQLVNIILTEISMKNMGTDRDPDLVARRVCQGGKNSSYIQDIVRRHDERNSMEVQVAVKAWNLAIALEGAKRHCSSRHGQLRADLGL